MHIKITKILSISFLLLYSTSCNDGANEKSIDGNDTDTEIKNKIEEGEQNPLNVSDADFDIDNDGVPNLIERMLGLDPSKRDTDGDGINDYDELQRSSVTDKSGLAIDPRFDSDGDGIPNQIELLMGTNPNDVRATQSAYKGGWNINPNKEQISEPPFPADCPGDIGCACTDSQDCFNGNCLSTTKGSFCHPMEGSRFPRFRFEDQFGDIVDFYDFAGQGKPILLEISAQWGEPCNDFSAWIHSNDKSVYEYQWWKPSFNSIRDIILGGKVQYVNVQYECDDKEGFTNSECLRNWYNKFPTEGVPVLGDFNQELFEWTKANGMPVFYLIDENMDLINFSNRGMGTSFDILLSRFK